MTVSKTKRRENGSGYIYQRENGKWVGRLYDGVKSDGSPKIKYFSGKSEAEVKKKIREYNKSGLKIDIKKITVKEYILNWLAVYKKDSLKPSSYDRLENTVKHQVIPNIGMIQLQQLNSDDIQSLLNQLKSEAYSYSTIKKVHDCLNDVLTHATIKGDIVKNPMLLVKMPEKNLFETKEIRYFNKQEIALIKEECERKYKNGNLKYSYGDVYILMLNTGLRMGEVIGLEKADWDKENKTLHIQRNVQSIMKRDKNGKRIKGRELNYNTTKTYSGDRILPVNKTATEALERLCAKSSDEIQYIVCQTNGKTVPPDRIERTFYRILKNIGIEKTGTHSLRHTFASILFADKVDIKTVSKLLGHASIQITLNTYIHIIENIEHEAVALLDDIF